MFVEVMLASFVRVVSKTLHNCRYLKQVVVNYQPERHSRKFAVARSSSSSKTAAEDTAIHQSA
ncbi:hypothetical protein E2C01_001331 [Portunus trituberculatus]|uniref:Uncharacterized protein n=1 Tax=Portunus trituberculatus TaxID=210409 RepID=A0A5B7CHQ4_PORTR|nr:hypothetical protein [Portunus trituberculatus]